MCWTLIDFSLWWTTWSWNAIFNFTPFAYYGKHRTYTQSLSLVYCYRLTPVTADLLVIPNLSTVYDLRFFHTRKSTGPVSGGSYLACSVTYSHGSPLIARDTQTRLSNVPAIETRQLKRQKPYCKSYYHL